MVKTDSDDPKAKGRIRRRNMIAKAMLEDRRRYGERRIKRVRKEDEKFNKHEILKRNYDNDEE